MGIFDSMLQLWINADFFQVLFPFLLALAIFYGVFHWALKDKIGKGPVALISVVLSFFVMLYAKQIPLLSEFLTWGSGTILAIATIVLFLIVVLALIGLKFSDLWGKERNWVMFLIVIIVLYIVLVGLGAAIPSLGIPLSWLVLNQDVWAVVLFVIILAVVLWFLGREPKEKKE